MATSALADPLHRTSTPPIEPGYLEVFRDFPLREEVLAATHRAFSEGIELLAGRECRERVEADGLALLHKHFPHASLGDLEFYVVEQVKPLWTRWAARVGRETVGWDGDFFVQDLLLLRVNYPYEAEPIAATSKAPLALRLRHKLLPPIEKLRYARYPRKLWRRLPELFAYMKAKRAALPEQYRCHPSHTDSWFGQPVGSLSLWLGIAGVQRDNAMCLYPETAEMRLPQDGLMYFGSGFQLPPATRPDHGDGDLLVFSTDMLHCTQLNVSDRTRIAFSIRISPGEPVFDEDNFWYVAQSHRARALLAGDASRPGRHGARTERIEWREEGWPLVAPTVQLEEPFSGERTPVARSEQLAEGAKLVVRFPDREVLLFRTGAGLRAYPGRCPHHAYRLADGPHDAAHLTCPGHGLEFDLETGRSKLDCFRLRGLAVSEEAGQIFLG